MATSTAAHTPLHPMTTWILWLWVPFLASLSHCPKPCFSLDIFVRFLPQHLHDATLSSDCGCTVLVSFIVCLFFLASHSLSIPQFYDFTHSLYRDCSFFFFLPKVTNDLLVKPSDSCRASDNFDHHSFLFSLSFLTFWLHSAFTLFSSCVWNAGSNLLVNIWQLYPWREKTNKQTNKHLWCAMLSDFCGADTLTVVHGFISNDQHKITECRIEKRCEQLCLQLI